MSEYSKYLDEIIKLDENQKNKLDLYFKILEESSKHMNLTTITAELDVYIKHFYDSILVLLKEENIDNLHLLDIGSGAGLPGIVLKIAYPKLNITLLDATKKRCDFLETVIEKLELDGINVICDRAENYVTKARETYDIVTARAVAPLNILLELSMPFVKIGGKFLAMKGQNYQVELDLSANSISILGGKITNKYLYKLPLSDSLRCIIEVKKTKKTPNTYPRSYAKIKQKPL